MLSVLRTWRVDTPPTGDQATRPAPSPAVLAAGVVDRCTPHPYTPTQAAAKFIDPSRENGALTP